MLARFCIALVLVGGVFGFAMPASAQTFAPASAPLFLSITPRNPGPGENVRVSATSHVINLADARLVWMTNGQLAGDDVGLTEIITTMGTAGSALHVVAAVIVDGELASEADAYIRPAAIDLLWEANSFTPPFYRGRKMPSPGSTVRVEAHAYLTDVDGNRIPKEQLTYTWRRNNAILKAQSGAGKNTVTLPAPLLFGDDTVSVEVVSRDELSRAETTENIPSTDSTILLFQDHPLFGILYHNALPSSATLPDSEIALAAVPLFAPGVTAAGDSLLSYNWRVNGAAIVEAPEAPDRLTVNADNSSGLARIELSISHLTDIFMQADDAWELLLNAGFGGVEQGDPFAPTPSL